MTTADLGVLAVTKAGNNLVYRVPLLVRDEEGTIVAEDLGETKQLVDDPQADEKAAQDLAKQSAALKASTDAARELDAQHASVRDRARAILAGGDV